MDLTGVRWDAVTEISVRTTGDTDYLLPRGAVAKQFGPRQLKLFALSSA